MKGGERKEVESGGRREQEGGGRGWSEEEDKARREKEGGAILIPRRFSLRVQDDYLKLINVPPPPTPYQFCILCPIPLFHVTASHHIFLSSFLIGRKLVLLYKW
jgi:hypothetical protein